MSSFETAIRAGHFRSVGTQCAKWHANGHGSRLATNHLHQHHRRRPQRLDAMTPVRAAQGESTRSAVVHDRTSIRNCAARHQCDFFFFARLFRLTKYHLPLVLVLALDDVPRAFFLLFFDAFGSEMPATAVAPHSRPSWVNDAS